MNSNFIWIRKMFQSFEHLLLSNFAIVWRQTSQYFTGINFCCSMTSKNCVRISCLKIALLHLHTFVHFILLLVIVTKSWQECVGFLWNTKLSPNKTQSSHFKINGHLRYLIYPAIILKLITFSKNNITIWLKNLQASPSSIVPLLLQSCCVKLLLPLPHLNESSQIHRPWTTQREPINWSVNKPDFNLELMDDNFDGKQMSSSVHKGNFIIAFNQLFVYNWRFGEGLVFLKIGWHVSLKCMVKK